ncbi:cobaltochelatase subunit CobN [Flammeovirga kamogawensis]|uniref:Cobaltochelatase subunit CobN n=1 Tax=Flammeovirga kamogawensis TaxID=373891 RepID=A0ABX8H3C0_9BACT|nr:cobaltochelatase subunit CobN [Flammeovirga kamogawensis]MBB6460350.1 cobaltochelatase CobN [Flammeovirga kamogawensis]QWG10159.1 cobaltochelatase subunit CobN [Flammeovirga kamogawensis]TRX64611.1 cobaltochelatase subunit CobN [Flammeovirga kamogawensis]
MHLISTLPGGWNPNDEGVFHIQQSGGDILFLSAADTELFTLNKVYSALHKEFPNLPSLRLANLTYFKQELTIDTYLDEVVSKAKVVVLKLLGGTAYFTYLCEAISSYAEEHNIALLFLPGDNQPDVELMHLSTLPLPLVNKIWSYFVAGGNDNTKEGLKLIMKETLQIHFEIKEQIDIADVFLYHHKLGIIDKKWKENNQPTALIFAYRSNYLADNLAPILEVANALEQKGITAITLMALTYREIDIQQRITELLALYHIQSPTVIINTTGFSLQGFKENESKSLFEALNIPIIQAIQASCSKQVWEEGSFGLPPTDIAMNIALPEVDGKIIGNVISFKEAQEKDALTDSEIVSYQPHLEGCQFIANHVEAWINLQKKENKEKNIAVILPNYPSKNSRLANGVGLDTPASTLQILQALKENQYTLNNATPTTTEELIDCITDTITNDLTSLAYKKADIKIKAETFYYYYNYYSEKLRKKVEEQWGHPSSSPNYRDGYFLIPGKKIGNVFLSIQPNRGYNIDLQASYHSPDLPPTYAYLAYYIWLQEVFKADAIIHVGKHGNLEWLPGKSVALSKESCFPEALLGAIPHFYPFIINDPGEGTQAKRRNHAIILDHLIPPMTRAENYGELLQLELLIDEFYESALLDPKRANLIKSKIETLVNETHLKKDLNEDGKDIDALLEVIDGYLCELKEAQIRGGLHIFGCLPIHEKLIDLIVALHRLPQGSSKSIIQCLAIDLKLDIDVLDTNYETEFKTEIFGIPCRSIGQIVEVLENRAKTIIECIVNHTPIIGKIGVETQNLLHQITGKTLPTLKNTTQEISNLMAGLNAAYIPSGGSGAPTRGRLDILPTGRNFYSVDTRTIPSPSAYELGVKSAQNIIDRYLQEEGQFPEAVAISVWGTSTMRTGGDDIAQALALLGVWPIWQGVNRRVKDFEIIPLITLKRPRVDVLLRISGFFRDAFPDVISLFNTAVEKVAALDEPHDQNPIKARVEGEIKEWKNKGLDNFLAQERALYRVFGSKPGAYGAGLQGLIDEKNWTTQEDLANVFINWGGYAYSGSKNEGKSAHESFKKRLSEVEIVIQNQDNREHDLLDSDDYYQFQGGMTAAVTMEKGEAPTTYFGDHSRPDKPRIKSLKEELLKVYRSRVINPKWMDGMRDHGYKGAFEMAATMDYLFAYDATTNLIEDFMYEGITEEYLLDQENLQFLEHHNPWAIKDMSERMLEAIQRGMWKDPSEAIIEKLEALYLKAEGALE